MGIGLLYNNVEEKEGRKQKIFERPNKRRKRAGVEIPPGLHKGPCGKVPTRGLSRPKKYSTRLGVRAEMPWFPGLVLYFTPKSTRRFLK